MRNNRGSGRFEIITVIVLLLVIFAVGAYMILGGANNQKFNTMKENAWSFSKTVATNIASFHYSNVVYLGEAIDEGLFSSIKNPFGKGDCDITESKVETIDGKPYVTLKCGKYLIDQASFEDKNNVSILEVSEWTTEKPKDADSDNLEEVTMYNCLDGDKEIFDNYYEELYFIFKYNKEFGTDIYFASDVLGNECELTSKTFYRTHKVVE